VPRGMCRERVIGHNPVPKQIRPRPAIVTLVATDQPLQHIGERAAFDIGEVIGRFLQLRIPIGLIANPTGELCVPRTGRPSTAMRR